MKYLFSYESPNAQYINIEFIVEDVNSAELMLQLPSWRPGRYELGNFARNIRSWKAFDENNQPLHFEKVTKDLWKVNTSGVSSVTIKYSYYAAELNAGSTWLDESQMYVNPVNCCFYVPGRMDEPCLVELKVPESYEIGTSLVKLEKNLLMASDFQQLADSPFIASATLQHEFFVYESIEFHIWFQGIRHPDWTKLFSDFFIFVNEQYLLFGDFPVKEYHFLFQILPYSIYHGVEHLNSTVIALGPAYDVFEGNLYNELLGVSSHELFHVWNIKKIRPAEMYPYDFTRENYSRLGYVAEGFTTYYGDLMLFRSKAISEEAYFKILGQQLKKHFDNPGRFNHSVAESSFDTWLDGYVPGIPNRKVSIYTEGCLIAFMIDILIRRGTNNEKSLDDVMRVLYYKFGKKDIGYTEKDVLAIISAIAGRSLEDFFKLYIYGIEDFRPMLQECLEYLGLNLKETSTGKYSETYLGFKSIEEGAQVTVKSIYPDSPADKAGLMINDVITSINGNRLSNNIENWCRFYSKEEKVLRLGVFSSFRQKELIISVQKHKQEYFKNYVVEKSAVETELKQMAFKSWAGVYVRR